MKIIIGFLIIGSFTLGALAQENGIYTTNDRGATQLIKLFAGKTLVCVPSDLKSYKMEDKGFYPLKITASPTRIVNKTVVLSIQTADPKVGFGYGGNDLGPIEISPSWIIITVGDDGDRHLMLEHYDDFAKENDCFINKKGIYEGAFPGIMSTIWDAGTIGSYGVQCCFEKRK